MIRKETTFTVILAAILAVEVAGYAEKTWRTVAPTLPAVAQTAADGEIDRRFVEALASRYRDTITLAERERTHGRNPELRKLATALLEARRHELDSLLRIAGADTGVPTSAPVAR